MTTFTLAESVRATHAWSLFASRLGAPLRGLCRSAAAIALARRSGRGAALAGLAHTAAMGAANATANTALAHLVVRIGSPLVDVRPEVRARFRSVLSQAAGSLAVRTNTPARK